MTFDGKYNMLSMKNRYERTHGYTYGHMIVTKNHMTVAELTEGVFPKWTHELEIMGSICDFYDYSWRFYLDGRLVLANSTNKNLNWIGKNDCGHHEYQSLNDMLRDWLDELTEDKSKEQFDDEIYYIKYMML